MQKLIVTIALLATAAQAATAQEARPAGLIGRRAEAAAQPRVDVRPTVREVRSGSRPLAQPVGYCPAARSVDVVRVASDAIATIRLGRYVWSYGLPEARAQYSRPSRTASISASTGARFGLKVGLSASTIRGVQDADISYVLGAHGGVMADISLGDYLSFHPELLYSQKGARGIQADPLGIGVSISSRERLHYLDLPLLLRAKAGGFFFEAGPQLGYLLAHKAEDTITFPGQDPITETDNTKDSVCRLDVGYVLGLGYALPQGLEVGVRYNGGLADVQDPSADPKLRNSVFQFQVGYLFGGR
jgi:hypothetical protein